MSHFLSSYQATYIKSPSSDNLQHLFMYHRMYMYIKKVYSIFKLNI